MNHDQFVNTVAQEARVGFDEAERATRATLETLAERIAAGEARDLAEQLPPELAPWLAPRPRPERLDADQFVRHVARREGIDDEEAERHARAVFEALRRTVTPKEFSDLVAELPKDFAALLPQGTPEVVSVDSFTRRVADRTGLRQRDAKRVVEAVLETLAERIAAGEVDDLEARLPRRLHAALERGKERSGGKAQRMSFEQFVQKVAEREAVKSDKVDVEAAREHVVDVLRTLREAVGDDEFFDLSAELPREFHEALQG
jgi:uncharacterized protein (DUF2267 family)